MNGVAPGLVSVIVPVHDRAALLVEAVESALAQTYPHVEILIVDDASTDDTPEACRALEARAGGRVTVLRAEVNGGAGAAREIGRARARGEFLQYLDSDDLLEPAKLERQVAALRAHPEAAIAYCAAREYRLGEPAADTPSQQSALPLDRLFPAILSGCWWPTLSPLWRRELTDRMGAWKPFREEEDWEYDARAGALAAELVHVPEILASVRNHGGVRASGNSRGNRRILADRAEAHRLVHGHARSAEVSADDPAMRRFSRQLFHLSRQCGGAGLGAASRELFELSLSAAGTERPRWDYRLYRGAASLLGWTTVGRVATWIDDNRPAPRGTAAA